MRRKSFSYKDAMNSARLIVVNSTNCKFNR